MTNEVKPLKIKCKIMWAFLNEVNQMSGKYQVDLTDLSKAAVDALAAQGIEAGHKDGQGFYITCKSVKYPIEAQLADGSRVPQDVKVGNGSEAWAIVTPYDWKFKNKTGRSPSLKKLVITELVKFEKEVNPADAVDVDGTGFEDMEDDIL